MIYFTIFIITLLLTHIAHAEPACGDVASPEDMYDLTYDNKQVVLDDTVKVTWSNTYDNGKGDTSNATCSSLATEYPNFEDFPDFPYLGASYDIKQSLSNCGKCWKLTGQKSRRYIYFTAIDGVDSGFKISKYAFANLGAGIMDPPTLYAKPVLVDPEYCARGFERKN